MSDSLLLNGRSIAYEDIKTGSVSGKSDFEETTLQFCRQWLNEQSSFSLKTSGSTGVPKTITVSREQMLASARQTITHFRITPDDTVLVCLNTAYIAGIMMLVRGFVARATIIAVEPVANPLLSIAQKIDFLAVVPLQLDAILHDKTSTTRLNNIRATIVGGAPVNFLLQKKLQQTSAAVWATFGMTETLTHFAVRQLSPTLETVYTAFANTTISVNNSGCLVVSGPVTNYNPLDTNDLVVLKGDRQFEWIGRADNIINSGGAKLQIETLEKKAEKMMLEQGMARNFFIAAVPDSKLGQKVALIIEGEGDEGFFQSIPWVTYFEKFEKPRAIHFLWQFVYTPTGKINRGATMNLVNAGA